MSAAACSHALVRDYLTRFGYRAALSALDAARPLNDTDITSRSDLVRTLQLQEPWRASGRNSNRSTLLEHVVNGRLAECARKIRGTTDSEDDGDDSDEADSDNEESQRPTVSVSLPPQLSAPLPRPTSGRPASARPARPDSAIGARTPNIVGGRVFGPVGVTELPSKVAAKLAAAPEEASRAAGGISAPPLVAKAVGFSGCSKERIIVRPGDCHGGVISLEFLDGCEVLILDWSSQVTIDACNACRILIGPVDGSIMVRESVSMHISAVCRQLRCRDCSDCVLRLFTLGPVIESSQRMTFGPWNAAYPQLSRQFSAARLDPAAENLWHTVHDFNDPENRLQPANWWRDEADSTASWTVSVVPGDDTGSVYGRAENPVDRASASPRHLTRVSSRLVVEPAGVASCRLRVCFR